MARDYLKELRKDSGLSQAQIAEKLQVTQQYYSLIENGNRQQNISIEIVEKLAEIFKIPISRLVEMERS